MFGEFQFGEPYFGDGPANVGSVAAGANQLKLQVGGDELYLFNAYVIGSPQELGLS